jgi:hypothetical protein
MIEAVPARLASECRGTYQTFMKRSLFSIILVCILTIGGTASGATEKRRPEKKKAGVHSGPRDFGRKVENAFRSVGGHLQKFFTGRDTITR